MKKGAREWNAALEKMGAGPQRTRGTLTPGEQEGGREGCVQVQGE